MADDETQVERAALETERPAKKRWSDLSPNQRTAIVVGAIVELILTSIALRDLAHRRTDEVRGWKPVWVMTFFVQPIGPVLYFLVGRRRVPR